MKLFSLVYILMTLSLGSLAGPVYDIVSFSASYKATTPELSQKVALNSLVKALDNIKVSDIGKEINTGNINEILTKLFELKRAVRTTDENTSIDLVNSKKLALTKIRLFEESITEKFYFKRNPFSKKKAIVNSLEGDFLFNQGIETNANHLAFLKSGDIVLTRGQSAISASIARFSEFPMMHSHVAMVYEDPKTKEKFLVESITKRGLQALPVEKVFTKVFPRIAVYRSKNVAEAEAAARLAYEMAKYSVKNNYGFGFDFSMNLTSGFPTVKKINLGESQYKFNSEDIGQCRFFCSKLISFVYNTEDETLALPKYPSKFKPSMNFLLNGMGIAPGVKDTFFPGDIEFEPGFELVHDYRNPIETLDIRLEDAIVDDVYNRISIGEKEIRIRGFPKFVINIVHGVLRSKPVRYLLRKLSFVVDPNVKAEVLDTLFALDRIIKAVKTELKLKDKKGLIVLKDLSFDELAKLVSFEVERNEKVKKVLIDHASSKPYLCARFYAH